MRCWDVPPVGAGPHRPGTLGGGDADPAAALRMRTGRRSRPALVAPAPGRAEPAAPLHRDHGRLPPWRFLVASRPRGHPGPPISWLDRPGRQARANSIRPVAGSASVRRTRTLAPAATVPVLRASTGGSCR